MEALILIATWLSDKFNSFGFHHEVCGLSDIYDIKFAKEFASNMGIQVSGDDHRYLNAMIKLV